MAAPTPNTGYQSQELLSFLKRSLLADDYEELLTQIKKSVIEESKRSGHDIPPGSHKYEQIVLPICHRYIVTKYELNKTDVAAPEATAGLVNMPRETTGLPQARSREVERIVARYIKQLRAKGHIIDHIEEQKIQTVIEKIITKDFESISPQIFEQISDEIHRAIPSIEMAHTRETTRQITDAQTVFRETMDRLSDHEKKPGSTTRETIEDLLFLYPDQYTKNKTPKVEALIADAKLYESARQVKEATVSPSKERIATLPFFSLYAPDSTVAKVFDAGLQAIQKANAPLADVIKTVVTRKALTNVVTKIRKGELSKELGQKIFDSPQFAAILTELKTQAVNKPQTAALTGVGKVAADVFTTVVTGPIGVNLVTPGIQRQFTMMLVAPGRRPYIPTQQTPGKLSPPQGFAYNAVSGSSSIESVSHQLIVQSALSQDVFVYKELLGYWATAESGALSFIGTQHQAPSLFLFLGELGIKLGLSDAGSIATKTVAGAATKEVTKVVSKGFFTQLFRGLTLGLKTGLSVASGEGLGAAAGTALGGPIGFIVGFIVGDLAGRVVQKGMQFGSRIFGWIINAEFLGGIKNEFSKFLGNLPDAERKTHADGLKWLGILIVIMSLVVLGPSVPIFSAFLPWSATYVIDVARRPIPREIGGYGDGDPVALIPPISCDDPTGEKCKWPTNGRITQGPFVSSGGSHKGVAANSIDIGSSASQPVYATVVGKTIASYVVDGYTFNAYSGCADNTGSIDPPNKCNDGFGNVVIVESTDGTGRIYLFGHLSEHSVIPPGVTTQIDTVVGHVDHNGNSSGPHLHFQLLSPSAVNISSFTPHVVPVCGDGVAPDCCTAISQEVPGGSCDVRFGS